jgi:hypothetical protein
MEQIYYICDSHGGDDRLLEKKSAVGIGWGKNL